MRIEIYRKTLENMTPKQFEAYMKKIGMDKESLLEFIGDCLRPGDESLGFSQLSERYKKEISEGLVDAVSSM